MNISFFKKFKLNKKGYTDIVEQNVHLSEDNIIKEEEVEYFSEDLTQISMETFIDTTDPLNIAKYKNNLRLLEERTLATGDIAKFMIIRNDDFLPEDWIWRVASKDTGIEYGGSQFTYDMRMEFASKSIGHKDNLLFDIPMPDEEEKMQEVLKNIDKSYATLYRPVHFRSTKHFTVNTPLEYTGTYNNVDSNRKFYVIDTIDNFANSGYGYSADYRDAYLDVTHEGLSISSSAVVLIDENEYEKIISDEKIKKQLSERRVILYRGSAAVAINMYLSENGCLPYKPGKYYDYNEQTINIADDCMKKFCSSHDLLYSQGHGNLFGTGGHFSDNLDNEKHDHLSIESTFLNFLKNRFPNYEFSNSFLKDNQQMRKFIRTIGIDNVLKAIDDYNNAVYQDFNKRFIEYKRDRDSITPEISYIFKTALSAVKRYYANEFDSYLSIEDRGEMFKLIKVFFHANKVEDQLLAATMICQKLNVNIDDISKQAGNTYS